jgi:diguanylate cyclase (GGDEF)-like protein
MTPWIRRYGLDHWVGVVLDWNPIQRSALLMFLILIETLQYGLWAVYVYFSPQTHAVIAIEVIEQSLVFGWLLPLLNLLLFSLCLRYRKDLRPRVVAILQYSVAFFYTIEMTYFGCLIGTFSIAGGVVLMGAPIFGLFMLKRRTVYVAFVSGTLAMLLLTHATVRGVLPYAPLLIGVDRLELKHADFWYWSIIYFIVPHMVIILGLCDLLMTSLRRREAEVRYLSERDALTGLLNRRSLHRLMHEMYQHKNIKHQWFGLLLLDLDHFKNINDQHGHLIGDEVLKMTADVLRHAIRQQDLAGRFGGEEFVVVLENANTCEVECVAERIRAQLQALRIVDEQGQPVVVSGSFGAMSLALGKNIRLEQAIHWVDQALYQAKSQGRNQVVMVKR